MRTLLVSNYKEDRQKSMLRFGDLLASNFNKEEIVVDEVFPKSKLKRFCFGSTLSKWAGYIDKYVIFHKKIESLFKKNSYDLIHIIDHSNSVYLPKLSQLSKAPKITTCHDLIAIRTASGEFPQAPVTSNKGKRLQKWIEKSLAYSDFYVCDSLQTQSDLNIRIPESGSRSKVIHLGVEKLNTQNFIYKGKLGFDLTTNNYALHIGSDAWYKNRKGVLESFKFACENQEYLVQKLVFVGPKIQPHELNSELDKWLTKNFDKTIFLSNITEVELQVLYQNAKLLIFPSFIEGFGWPPLEAHINNCPSVTSKTGAIFEILKDSALYANPNNQEELNNLVYSSLLNMRKVNFNKPLPTNEECAKKYAHFYRQVILNKS